MHFSFQQILLFKEFVINVTNDEWRSMHFMYTCGVVSFYGVFFILLLTSKRFTEMGFYCILRRKKKKFPKNSQRIWEKLRSLVVSTEKERQNQKKI